MFSLTREAGGCNLIGWWMHEKCTTSRWNKGNVDVCIVCVITSHTHLPARHTCRRVQYEGRRGPFREGPLLAAAWPCSGPDVQSWNTNTHTLNFWLIIRKWDAQSLEVQKWQVNNLEFKTIMKIFLDYRISYLRRDWITAKHKIGFF